jgi:hypothetical protein
VGAASAQPETDAPRVVLDRELRPIRGRIVALNTESLTIREESGLQRTMPRGEVLAILPERAGRVAAGPGEQRPMSRLHLVDGQVLPGSLSPGDEGEAVRWESALAGPVRVALEDIAAVVLGAGPTPERPSTLDVVRLQNGDVLEGFVAGVGSMVRVERDGRVGEVPVSRVASIALANPARVPEGVTLWFHDGTVLGARDVTIGEGVLRATPTLGSMALRVDARDLRAALLDPGAVRPLSGIPWTMPAQTGGRRWTPPPIVTEAYTAALFAGDIELPGPMRVEWTLPAGAALLACEAELPESSRVWGDCVLIVEVDGRELVRRRLHGDDPRADLRLDFGAPVAAGSRLRVTLDPGHRGSVQDRVVLRRPLVLVR